MKILFTSLLVLFSLQVSAFTFDCTSMTLSTQEIYEEFYIADYLTYISYPTDNTMQVASVRFGPAIWVAETDESGRAVKMLKKVEYIKGESRMELIYEPLDLYTVCKLRDEE